MFVNRLPNEIKCLILAEEDPLTLTICERVCKDARDFLADTGSSTPWLPKCKQYFSAEKIQALVNHLPTPNYKHVFRLAEIAQKAKEVREGHTKKIKEMDDEANSLAPGFYREDHLCELRFFLQRADRDAIESLNDLRQQNEQVLALMGLRPDHQSGLKVPAAIYRLAEELENLSLLKTV